MMYVSDRTADSICDTALEFLMMKSSYLPSHLAGNANACSVDDDACR
jgi:hypothetical protein